jgi:peroxiredoxin
MKKSFLTIMLLLIIYPIVVFSQENKITVPIINEPISDFQLNDQNGNPVRFSSLEGKNVMLVFPRGMVRKDYWCQICHYQYADLADIVKKENILKKYNLEVLFILPYQSDSITNWINMFPKQMEIIDGWKFPKDSLNISDGAKRWANTTRKLLPKKLSYSAGNIETPFPILSDGQRTVSKGFQLYKNEPDAPQNMPAIMIIDKDGILRYKYLSQDTKDRPAYDYLFKIMDVIL